MSLSALALHRFVFVPNKLNIRSSAELKAGGVPSTSGAASAPTTADCKMKGQTLETIMFRLVTFMAQVVSLPYKKYVDVSVIFFLQFLRNKRLNFLMKRS